MNHSKAQIVATLGPASTKPEILKLLVEHQVDVARLNFAWGTFEERIVEIKLLRDLSKKAGKKIPIIVDLPGPRIQKKGGHTYDLEKMDNVTEQDEKSIEFGIKEGVEYFAVSFVGNADDVERYREVIKKYSGNQKIIAKIERKMAVKNFANILSSADAIMIARGDLGSEIPIEQIPFVQDKIIKETKEAGKPVIVATQMMLSMIENPIPTRAEVTDVANAILEGADAVMLSEETTIGKYPVEAVTVMEKIVLEAEKHLAGKVHFNLL